MSRNRLEAFSDGVIAIIITIMVLELKVPAGDSIDALRPLAPVMLGYVLSFFYVGIFWNNHHHLLQSVQRIDGRVLWANLHLLFWLSLIPFVTGWMGQTGFAQLPVASYGITLLMAGIAYRVLTKAMLRVEGPDSLLARAVGADRKGLLSLVLYAVAVPLCFSNRWAALAIYVGVAVIWVIPDRRIESAMTK